MALASDRERKMKTSFKIKNLTIRNRIAIPPMVCFYWSDDNGYVTEKNIEHYKDLAEGGAGLVIVEATAITKRSRLHDTELGIWEDGQIDGLSKIADVIHQGGAAAFIQLVHAGGNGIDDCAEVPSYMEYRWAKNPTEMSQDRINVMVEDFAKAAVRAKRAGFDGVEIHGCHGYLLSQFFNSRNNIREDEYGKDKALAAKQVLKAVKAACGEDFIVGIRIGAFEPYLLDGMRNSFAVAPYADFLDVSYGGDCNGTRPEGYSLSEAVYGASKIKKLLPEMPVFGVHNINSKEDVKAALETGIDMVDIGKASLVDSGFAKHILSGEPYGQCLHCNNYCRWNPPQMANPDLKCPGYVKFAGKRENE